MELTNEAHTSAKHKDPVQSTYLHKLIRFISGTQHQHNVSKGQRDGPVHKRLVCR